MVHHCRSQCFLHSEGDLNLYLWAAVLALGTVSLAFYRGWITVVAILAAAGIAAACTVYLPRWFPPKAPKP